MADPVRAALQARLKAYTPLTALLATTDSVYHRRAPQTARAPMVVLDKRSGVPSYTLGGDSTPVVNETWVIRGVAFGRTADRAEDIAIKIEAALTDAPLSLSAGHLIAIFKDSDVDYPEQVGKEIFQHSGGVYRVLSQGT